MTSRVLLVSAMALLLANAHPRGWTSGSTLLGVYYGNQGWKMDQVQALEAWQGKKHAVVVLFTNWDATSKVMNNLFGQQLPNIWNSGSVPMVTWEPFTGRNTPADIELRIASGAYDAYVAEWAGRMRGFLAGPDAALGTGDDRRAYLRLAHEMNGDWYPWSAGGATSPAHYVAAWQRVRQIFDGRGLGPGHVQWVWAVNHADVGPFSAEEYFPGDAWIDWVAIDGYNWGTSQSWSAWTSPASVFDDMTTRVRALSTRPLAITETASSRSTGDGPSATAKSEWITQLFAWAATSDARMICWFNEDKETDWAVFGGAAGDGTYKYGRTTYRTYQAYRTAVQSAALVASNPSNPRHLTDAQFGGH